MNKENSDKKPVTCEFLPSPDRWKWMAGSAAAAGTLATSPSIAGTVQITQINSYVTRTTNNLKADITGDSVADLSLFTSSNTTSSPGQLGFYLEAYNGFTRLARVRARAFFTTFSSSTFYSATVGTVTNRAASPRTTRAFAPVTFSDSRINGGAVTNGLLEILAFNTALYEHEIRLIRLVFDDATTVAPANATPGGINPIFDPNVYAQRAAQAAAAQAAAKAARLARYSALSKKIGRFRAAQRKARRSGNTRLVIKLERKIWIAQRQRRALLL